jgi:hypothetical protein
MTRTVISTQIVIAAAVLWLEPRGSFHQVSVGFCGLSHVQWPASVPNTAPLLQPITRRVVLQTALGASWSCHTTPPRRWWVSAATRLQEAQGTICGLRQSHMPAI